ncbi:Hypothetical predicted protein [Paramuricea clavata]|uniref:Uncharacterized protein n=1 Tax=Paramuricea clavata TaxID=317549 RepID=A0A7D9IWQ5_PARCT|nr:Hypothetical predicted protein [Paramuricea clavata]
MAANNMDEDDDEYTFKDEDDDDEYVFKDGSDVEGPNTKEGVYIIGASEVGGKRVYDKKNSCFFCGKEYAKLARHFEQAHKNEEVVKKSLPQKKKTPAIFSKNG